MTRTPAVDLEAEIMKAANSVVYHRERLYFMGDEALFYVDQENPHGTKLS